MSRGANLSIMGLYNNDPTVLDMMVFPEGFTQEQEQNVKENILVECAEFEFLYPNPTVAKTIIGIWSHKELPYWQRVYDASQLEYNPIENYRRNETETIEDDRSEQHSGNDVTATSGTDTRANTGTETRDHDADHSIAVEETNVSTLSGSDALKRTGTDTTALSGSDELKRTGTDTNVASGSDGQSGSSNSTDTNSGTDTVNNSITGYDSNTLVPHDSSETVHGHVVTNYAQGTNTTTYGRTDTETLNTSDKTDYGRTETETLNTTDKTEYGKIDTVDHDSETTETHDDTDLLTLDTLETFVHGKTDTLTHGEKIEHEGTSERTVLAYGNIGVTTSQEMLTQEMEIAKIIQVVPIIIDSFKNRFCLMVY